jgi:hypothetical protein
MGRICFLEEPEHIISFPTFELEDATGTPLLNPRRNIDSLTGKYYDDEQEVNSEDIYEWLKQMEDLFPQINTLDFLFTYLPKVCPEGIVDLDAVQLYRIENAIKEYGVEILKVPYNLFIALETVRAAGNSYENNENFKREQSAKKMAAQQQSRK